MSVIVWRIYSELWPTFPPPPNLLLPPPSLQCSQGESAFFYFSVGIRTPPPPPPPLQFPHFPQSSERPTDPSTPPLPFYGSKPFSLGSGNGREPIDCQALRTNWTKFNPVFRLFQLSELEQRVVEAEVRAEDAEDKVSNERIDLIAL